MTWVRLEEGNDWGTVYYSLPGERLSGGGASVSNGVALTIGQALSVRMPDGTVLRLNLAGKRRHARGISGNCLYADPIQQEERGFWLPVHGLVLWVPLTTVDVDSEELTGKSPQSNVTGEK